MTDTNTAPGPYRYAFTFGGVNYAAPDVAEPSHAFLARTLADVTGALRDMARYGHTWGIADANGDDMLAVPCYGEPGDYAHAYVLPTPGADASAAHAALVDALAGDYYPDYVYTFGPRGGLARERV